MNRLLVLAFSVIATTRCSGGQTTSPLSANLPNSASAFGEGKSWQGSSTGHQLNGRGYKVLYRFKAGADGAHPAASLTDLGGMLYGTTGQGGGSGCNGGCGTVFAMSTTGQEQVLYSFAGGTDGAGPDSGLLVVNGAFYGTTYAGGGGSCSDGPGGCGTVFKVSTSGEERILYSFKGGKDGAIPIGNLITDTSGVLYGVTDAGGGTTSCSTPSGVQGCGTVFKLTPSGSGYAESVLYRFKGGSDGEHPYAGLIILNGTFYGTTEGGGAYGCSSSDGCGTVFKVSTSGKEHVLYSFKGYPDDGAVPEASLLAVKGALYGTTVLGGSFNNGAVFEMSTSGDEGGLGSFFLGGDIGAYPEAGLIAVNGKLYGTTVEGGAYKSGWGTVFKMDTSLKLKVLHSFAGGNGGGLPYTGLLAFNSELYGTTEAGGSDNNGTVFRISP